MSVGLPNVIIIEPIPFIPITIFPAQMPTIGVVLTVTTF
jgi:hypothetical protein